MTCDCECPDAPENTNPNTPLAEIEYDETDIGSCCGITCSRQCRKGSIKGESAILSDLTSAGSVVATTRPRPNVTRPTFRGQSGSASGGKILGMTTQQALVAVGIGVAAFFALKKLKK
jgi:hypothetical protein